MNTIARLYRESVNFIRYLYKQTQHHKHIKCQWTRFNTNYNPAGVFSFNFKPTLIQFEEKKIRLTMSKVHSTFIMFSCCQITSNQLITLYHRFNNGFRVNNNYNSKSFAICGILKIDAFFICIHKNSFKCISLPSFLRKVMAFTRGRFSVYGNSLNQIDLLSGVGSFFFRATHIHTPFNVLFSRHFFSPFNYINISSFLQS